MKKIHSLLLPAVVAGVASILASGIACADNVFVVNNGDNTVSEISNGVTTTFIASDLSSPTGIAISGNNVFVANNGNNAGFISEFSLSTGAFEATYSTGQNGPRGIAFDSFGNLFVANENNGVVTEIPTGGGPATTVVDGSNSPGTAFATGLAFDSVGNLYVASAINDTVTKVTFSSPGVVNSGTTFVSGLNFPAGIAFDSAGNLLVVNQNTSQILKFGPTGTPLGAVITDGNSLDIPEAVTVDSLGNLWVTDYGSGAVKEYDSLGNLLNTFTGNGIMGPCYITTELAVPEPSAYALLTAGLGLLFFVTRRKTATV